MRGELEIPAIRGVGGSLIYFLDRSRELGNVWNLEFDPIEQADAGRGADRVDRSHFAIDGL